jgi:hypothetical protein
MLRAEDLVGYSSLRDSSSHCPFETLSDAGEQCYRSLGLGRRPVLLSYLRYHGHLCQLPLCWEVVKFKASLEDSSYKLPYLRLASTEKSHSRAVSA